MTHTVVAEKEHSHCQSFLLLTYTIAKMLHARVVIVAMITRMLMLKQN